MEYNKLVEQLEKVNDSHRDFALSSVSPETGVFDEYSECLLSI
jgi:hypothetical protein